MRSRIAMSLIGSSCILTPIPVAAQDDVRLLWSLPPDGYMGFQNRGDKSSDDMDFETIVLAFSEDVSLNPAGIRVIGTTAPPYLTRLEGANRLWKLHLSHPLQAGTTTILSVMNGRFILTFHSRPGDLNADGAVNDSDHDMMLNLLAVSEHYDDRFDINGDGWLNQDDASAIALMQDNATQGSSPSTYEPMFSARCCCDGVDCIVVGGDCPTGTAEASSCPCTMDSCPDAEFIPFP